MKRTCINIIMIAIVVVVFVFMVGCSIKDDNNNNIDYDINNESDNMKQSIDNWIGEYTYSEFAEPDINMYYSIMIYKTKDGIYADISIDGFQRLERLKANVRGDGKLIEISFLEYLPDNLMELYNEADILISLERKDSEIYTSWGEIQPIIQSNIDTTDVYFEKSN